MSDVMLAESNEDIARCLPVMRHLRPSLNGDFVARVLAQQAQGYRLAYLVEECVVVAVAGFRVMEILSTGRTMYVDDLVTDETRRSQGHGKAMLDWLQRYARQAGCATFTLNSATLHQKSHAFYFREQMRVTSFHFAKTL